MEKHEAYKLGVGVTNIPLLIERLEQNGFEYHGFWGVYSPGLQQSQMTLGTIIEGNKFGCYLIIFPDSPKDEVPKRKEKQRLRDLASELEIE